MPEKTSENQLQEYEKEINKLSKWTALIKRKLSQIQNTSSEKEYSEIEKKIILLGDLVLRSSMQKMEESRQLSENPDLYEKLEVETELHEEDYEQLALPGFTSEKGAVRRKNKKVSAWMFRKENTFVKMESVRRQVEILQDLNTRWLNDFHKYMCTGRTGKAGKKRLAEELLEWIYEYPLQLLLTVDEAAVRILRKISAQKEGERLIVDEENVDACQRLAYFGLLDLRVICEGSRFYFGISVPEEVKDRLLPAWKEIRRESLEHDGLAGYLDQEKKRESYSVKKLQEGLNEFLFKILLMLRYYGAMGTEEFCRIFCEVFQADVSSDELLRFIYLRGTLHHEVWTGVNRQTGQAFVGMPGLNMDEIFLKREKYCEDTEYSVVSEEELTEAVRHTEELWGAVEEFFQAWEPEEGELREVCCEGNRMVLNGSGMGELVEYLHGCYAVDAPTDRAMLWRLLAMIELATPLPMLKGYSRHTFYEAFGRYRYLDMFRETGKKVRKAALYELPVTIQEKLLELAIISDKESYFDMVSREEHLPKECMQNEEVKLYLFINRTIAYRGIHDPVLKEREKKNLRDRAFALSEECRDSETTDTILKMCHVNGIVDYWSEDRKEPAGEQFLDEEWEDEYAAPEPIVKPAKIYPNDPCPCGSGKKYKKCCGRK